ncbi:response regulator [Streptomycetaceae bacterium NBC_01309]
MARRPFDILLVEDDLADALLIEEVLLHGGTPRRIAQVSDGVEALERLNDPAVPRPDLILLDLNMPRMNGRELLHVLKNDENLKVIPTVVLTTSGAPEDVAAAYRNHSNAYITKPVNLDDFTHAVRSIDTFFLDTAASPNTPE